jgi:hypothetical protein
MPWKPADINKMPSYKHSFWKKLVRSWQKLFVRKIEDRKFAAKFCRQMKNSIGEPAWAIAEKATKNINNTKKYVGYGLLEDTPWLTLKSLWVLRAVRKKYFLLNKK